LNSNISSNTYTDLLIVIIFCPLKKKETFSDRDNIKYNKNYLLKMKAAVFKAPGLENLEIKEYSDPEITDQEILIRAKVAGINPIDYFVVSGKHGIKSGPRLEAKPLPHIPGAEISGVVERVGNNVNRVNEGDRVVVYSRIFDGSCDLCLNSSEMLCKNGGLISVVNNGGFAEYIAVPEQNVFKIPDDMDWDLAASLSVTALTPFHALKEASLKINESLLVFGASGNTGMLAVQFAKKMGAKVIAVTTKNWIKEFGADHITTFDKVIEEVKEFTQGNMAAVVLNTLGADTWQKSLDVIAINGRWVTFGVLTGAEVKLNLQSLYSKQIKLIGTTGGSRKEFKEIIDNSKGLKIKVWKKFKLEEAREALQALFEKEREGRILLNISSI
jgi:NADPH:quinone reductase-like Zn-dependent oxidoreductase